MSPASITPVTFSREEIAKIREMLRTWEKPPVCPRCGGELVVEEPELEELKGRVYLKCKPCNRSAFASITP
jgi:transcription elongation factor Elf1